MQKNNNTSMSYQAQKVLNVWKKHAILVKEVKHTFKMKENN